MKLRRVLGNRRLRKRFLWGRLAAGRRRLSPCRHDWFRPPGDPVGGIVHNGRKATTRRRHGRVS